MPLRSLLFIPLLALNLVSAQATTPFTAPAVPLAVRNPYLNCWLYNGTNTNSPANNWPVFWQGVIQGWAGYIRVDGVAFRFLGDATVGGEVATQTSVTITATKSTFVYKAGQVQLTADFLSPIEPTDLVKQSQPFSYLALSVSSLDGASHNIQLYTDISGEWTNADSTTKVHWSTTTSQSSVIHQISPDAPQLFVEDKDEASYVTAYYGTSIVNGLTIQTGQDVLVRTEFVQKGVLNNGNDTQFRAISDNWPVLALSVDLGSITTSTSPIVFAIGVAPVNEGAIVRYGATAGSFQDRFLYYLGVNDTMTSLEGFLADYPAAASRAKALDAKLTADANAISSAGYSDLVALSTRQTWGSTVLTISKTASGGFNTSDFLVFMKGGDINTVDIIYPSFPLFLYQSPTIGRYLLEPTLRYLESGQDTDSFVPHDLGQFPVASGVNSGTEVAPIEENGNMLILALAVAQASGDGNILSTHYNTLKNIADYLVQNTLIPANQVSTDAFLGPQSNTSNLALKGILGIGAMHAINVALNKTGDTYSDTAKSYIQQWAQFAVSSDGTTTLSKYTQQNSSALLYNLYADKLLRLNLVPDNIYTLTQNYVNSKSAKYGVPFDSRQVNNTKSDWLLFTAGALPDPTTRDKLIELVHTYASAGVAVTPFGDYYDINTGLPISFINRPVQGAMFSLLALNQGIKNITLPNDSGGPVANGTATGSASQSTTTADGQPVGGATATHLSVSLFVLGVVLSLVQNW